MLLFRAPHERQRETNWGCSCCVCLYVWIFVYAECVRVPGGVCLCDALRDKLARTQQASLGRAAGTPPSHVGAISNVSFEKKALILFRHRSVHPLCMWRMKRRGERKKKARGGTTDKHHRASQSERFGPASPWPRADVPVRV